MAAKPWLTSDDLIESVKRKIMFPTDQSTFSEEDILAFANEEMASSQIPSILQFHEEYLVTTKDIPLKTNRSRYAIPDRAIGMKFRDLYFKDVSGNLFEMTRVTGNDDMFSTGASSGTPPYKYKLEGNDVVLIPDIGSEPTGSLHFIYYLRVNQLVKNDRAAIVNYFTESIQIVNTSVVAGDTVTINDEIFTATAGAPGVDEFQIGATSIDTATNLVGAINTNGITIAVNGTPSTDTATLKFLNQEYDIEVSNSSGFIVASTSGIEFNEIPDNITNGDLIDFLQTKPGHKIISFDVQVPITGISGSNIEFGAGDIPEDLIVGDYICLSNECIIPQIPPDLHNVLAERTSARILSALGDQQGLQSSMSKIQEMEANQAKLIDNRSEGSPQKVIGRHTFLKLISRKRNNLRGW